MRDPQSLSSLRARRDHDLALNIRASCFLCPPKRKSPRTPMATGVYRTGCRVSVCPSVCNGCIVAKRCEIGLSLLLIINRKWHIGFQMK